MRSSRFRFERFLLDVRERELRHDGRRVDLSARYFDALTLLVQERGKLVSKDRFLDEVWGGVPVTDEALTQCIRILRRQLGDDAANPQFIETVPKHGYRFIGTVQMDDERSEGNFAHSRDSERWRRFFTLGGAGTIGGGFAGVIGGLIYGFAGVSDPLQPGVGALSVVAVLTTVTALIALLGAAGVSFGIAGAELLSGRPWRWSIAGAAAGGLVVGALVKLLTIDGFDLLVGRSPGDITGAAEGLVIGTAVGCSIWLANREPWLSTKRKGIIAAAIIGGAAGLIIPLAGRRMMGGSLDLLARHFPDSRLQMDRMGQLLGEHGFGPSSQMLTGALEGSLFSASVVAGLLIAGQRLDWAGGARSS